MIYRMKELEKLLNTVDYNKLWTGFKKTKYAIYNDEKFYINDNSGIDINLEKEGSFYVGKTDARFTGNTAISINDNYVAIWNEGTIPEDIDNIKLASLIIHEMFHCYQCERGEKRFPNELLGMDYPITVENINMRMLERRYLLEACKEKNKERKKELLTLFYNIREKREKLIGDFIDYEKAVESVEGTAVYVEFQALNQLIAESQDIVLEKYMSGFTDIKESNLAIRQSSYRQGALLGLIADEFIPNWKHKFDNSKLFLSDFIKNELEIKEVDVDLKHEDLPIIEECINNWNEKRDAVFEEFERKDKLNCLEEGFQITGFDPMNVVKRNKEIIHKNILRIKLNDGEKIIKGPVKTTIGEHIFDVKKIEW